MHIILAIINSNLAFLKPKSSRPACQASTIHTLDQDTDSYMIIKVKLQWTTLIPLMYSATHFSLR